MERLGRALPGDAEAGIGESWELSDLASSSVSGGGGGAERSVVVNGPLKGKSLNELMQAYGTTLMGKLTPSADGGFPILIKFLDAAENLSIQVHPSPQYAREHDDVHLKSEAWYIVDADPGAVIYKGIREGVTAEQFRAAIETNDPQQVVNCMIAVPVRAGDCHYLPSGTCHALGAGVLVAEVQTPSDTTFRVFDWGRTDRELHIEQAMQCIAFESPDTSEYEQRAHIAGMFTTVSRLVNCEHFRIEKVRMSEGYEQEIPYDQPTIWILLQGKGTISPGNGATDVSFHQGQTLLMPAAMKNATVQLEEDTVWLEVTFPQTGLHEIA